MAGTGKGVFKIVERDNDKDGCNRKAPLCPPPFKAATFRTLPSEDGKVGKGADKKKKTGHPGRILSIYRLPPRFFPMAEAQAKGPFIRAQSARTGRHDAGTPH